MAFLGVEAFLAAAFLGAAAFLVVAAFFLVGAFNPALAVVDLRADEVFGAAFLAGALALVVAVFFVAVFLGAAAWNKTQQQINTLFHSACIVTDNIC